MGFLGPQTPFMINLALAVVLILIILAAAATHETSSSSISNKFAIAKDGCSDRCGNVSIPYPFGMTEGCYLKDENNNFLINCSQTVSYWEETDIEIRNISLTGGQLTVMQFIASHCYAPNGTLVGDFNPWMTMIKFTISNSANKFVVVGCDTSGSIKGQRLDERSFRTGCTTTCTDKDDVEDGSCTGLGCCTTSIPMNVQYLDIGLETFGNYTNVSNLISCGYAFVVEQSSFAFSPGMITSLRDVEELPMVLDWAIGNQTCSEAAKAGNINNCPSDNSECYDPKSGLGYRCNCNQGYQGNPYLDDGCQDIDECKEGLHNCTQLDYCVNTNGSFICVCPNGYNGDGRSEGKGCNLIPKSEPPLFKLAAG